MGRKLSSFRMKFFVREKVVSLLRGTDISPRIDCSEPHTIQGCSPCALTGIQIHRPSNCLPFRWRFSHSADQNAGDPQRRNGSE